MINDCSINDLNIAKSVLEKRNTQEKLLTIIFYVLKCPFALQSVGSIRFAIYIAH